MRLPLRIDFVNAFKSSLENIAYTHYNIIIIILHAFDVRPMLNDRNG